jgi:sigma-B regulation protein RsbU (phosphoserine phosphatase)
VQGSAQFLFVSACYLIVDTERAEVHFSSAGHPSPVWADPSRHRVTPLEDARCTNAALGLTGETVYGSCTFPIGPGDTFLLFTDGLVEAPAASGEEFGEERLYALIRQNPNVDVSRLTSVVVDALNQWTGAITLPDDLCLVAVQAVCDTLPNAATPVT